jgi:uncharacterized peroxidase-related enzyme
MSDLKPLAIERLTGDSAISIAVIERELGFVPDLMRVLSHSRAALHGYLALRAALKGGVLPAALRERIAIAVANTNGCNSCLVNHRHLARCADVSDQELDAATAFGSRDRAAAAVLRFTKAVIAARGGVDAVEFAAVRDAGFGDAEIVEIATVIGANMLANFVNNLAHSARNAADA